MDPTLLGLVLDSSAVVTAERKRQPISEFSNALLQVYRQINVSLSQITVAELVHGIHRARTLETHQSRQQYIEQFLALIPLPPSTQETRWLVGQLGGQEAAKGNVLPMADLMIAAAAIEQNYAVPTSNIRHFERIPGLVVMRS